MKKLAGTNPQKCDQYRRYDAEMHKLNYIPVHDLDSTDLQIRQNKWKEQKKKQRQAKRKNEDHLDEPVSEPPKKKLKEMSSEERRT